MGPVVQQTRSAGHFFCEALPFAWLMLSACGTSPIDAVIAISTEQTGSPDGSAPDASALDASASDAGCMPQPGGNVRLISRVTGTCLAAGAPTSVFGMPAFDTAMSSDCPSPGAQWQLMPSGIPPTFYLRNVATGYYLDVKFAGTADGTLLILYPPTQLSNQRFLLRMRGFPYWDLEPQNAPASCVQEVAGSVQIWLCSPAVAPQEWVQQPSCQ